MAHSVYQGDALKNIWLTSDTHFDHKNIQKYCPNRGGNTLEEMNETLISNWNSKVNPGDTIYHIGDFSFGSSDKNKAIFNILNGNKILIRGNHDDKRTLNLPWAIVADEMFLYTDYKTICMSHYPRYDGELDLLYLNGHVHTEWKTKINDQNKLMINVGVDVWDMSPINVSSVIEIAKFGGNL